MLDTKSISSKKFSFIIALIFIITASVGYFMMYPVFEKRAAEYDVDAFSSSNFLFQLYQGSCVLYKDVTEAATGRTVEYADLYLQAEEEMLGELDGAEQEFFDGSTLNIGSYANAESWKLMCRERVNNILRGWQLEVLNGITKEIDYCVIDHATGKMIKNTGREIENLGTDEADEELNSEYVYYIRASYGNAGNLESVAVKGKNSAELLKSAQLNLKSNHLWTVFWGNVSYEYGDIYSDGSIFFQDSNGNLGKEKITVSSMPKNITCIFALTAEQQEKLLTHDTSLISGQEYIEYVAYYRADTIGVFFTFFFVLAVIALIMVRVKKYCLHTLTVEKLHIEVSLLAIFMLIGIGENIIIGLVNFTNRGRFDQLYTSIGWIPEAAYPVLTCIINLGILFVVFAGWYYLITSFGELFVIGIRAFVRERSLIYKIGIWIKRFCRRNVDKFKEEILHVDLGVQANKTIRKLVVVNFLLLALVCCMWVFGWMALFIYSIILYFCMKKYVQNIQAQYRNLFDATRSIANGNLQTQFDNDWGIFESYKEELSKIQDGIKVAVEEEVKSQKMKTELITNVSHDLKTPLTAITTYIELLEDENITPEQRTEYLDVLKRKSARLKFLIEDLFEVSKATSGNITLNLVDVDICNLIRQAYLEYEDRVEEAGLIFRFQMPEEKTILKLDSQKTYRIFENLYTNIIKYAMPHTRVYVRAEKTERGIAVELKNMSAAELNIPAEDLTERFVRGDSSRNTEGSGLGLAIARSFVEAQGGKMNVEIDGDLFKVRIEW